jgi:hypothetical protein
MPKTIHPRADAFTGPNGLLPHGAYADIIRDTSTAEWDRHGGLVKRRRTQRKAWIFVGAYTADLMVGLAIVDAGYLANAFAYFYVPSENLYQEQKVIVPYGFISQFEPELTGEWNLRNFSIGTIGSSLHANTTGNFQMNIEIEHNSEGLSFMCPAADRPFNFTYKNLCLETAVSVFYNGRRFKSAGRIGGIDFSKGYPPRHTHWNWALVSGTAGDGRPVGMNLFKGHNGKYENAAWIGDQRVLLPTTEFLFDQSRPLDRQEWQLRSDMVDVRFTPSHARREKINAALLSHDFVQPFGRFEGLIRLDSGPLAFTGFGPVEEHTSLW